MVYNIAGATTPFQSLVGIFFNTSALSSAPATLSFATDSERSYATLSPLLQQVFFIGDGLTGTGSGQTQSVMIPSNADALFLAPYDVLGGSGNNVGALNVSITSVLYDLQFGDAGALLPILDQPPPPPNGAPEPATLALAALGLTALGFTRRRRQQPN